MKKILAMLLAGMMVMGLAACGGGDSGAGSGSSADAGTSDTDTGAADADSADGGSGEGYNIDVILKTTASEYWGYVQAGALAYNADHPEVTVDVKGATSETAYDEQLRDFGFSKKEPRKTPI